MSIIHIIIYNIIITLILIAFCIGDNNSVEMMVM